MKKKLNFDRVVTFSIEDLLIEANAKMASTKLQNNDFDTFVRNNVRCDDGSYPDNIHLETLMANFDPYMLVTNFGDLIIRDGSYYDMSEVYYFLNSVEESFMENISSHTLLARVRSILEDVFDIMSELFVRMLSKTIEILGDDYFKVNVSSPMSWTLIRLVPNGVLIIGLVNFDEQSEEEVHYFREEGNYE